jgi:hypothetical protein
MVLLLLQCWADGSVAVAMLSGWFCCCCKGHCVLEFWADGSAAVAGVTRCVRMLGGWLCYCCNVERMVLLLLQESLCVSGCWAYRSVAVAMLSGWFYSCCRSHSVCQYVERMVLLLLQESLCVRMLSGWFCCNSDSMCQNVERMVMLLLQCWADGYVAVAMLSGWFCCCCRRRTVAGSAPRCSRTSWPTAQNARGRAAACASGWSRGVPSSCRGIVFPPTPHNTPESPPFCASVGGTPSLLTSRDKPSSISFLPCSLVVRIDLHSYVWHPVWVNHYNTKSSV